MFGKLYVGELRKLARPKSMIAVGVVLVVLFIVMAVIYNFLADLMENIADAERMGFDESEMVEETQDGEFFPDEEKAFEEFKVIYNEETVAQSIAELEKSQAEYEKMIEEEKDGYYYTTTLYNIKATLVAYRYIQENKLYDKAEEILYGSTTNDTTAESFTESYMGISAIILCIYGLVMGAGLLADEYKNGTIKMLFSRPVTQNQVITAKLSAVSTIVLGFFSLSTLLVYIYGVIAFEASGTTTQYLVFNASKVIKSTVGAYTFGEFMMYAVNMVTYALCAFCIGTLTRKKTIGILVALIIDLGVCSGLLGFTPLAIACLSSNSNLLVYFSTSSNVPVYGNFFISLAVYVAYIAIFAVGLYIPFKKRDII